MGVGKKGEVAVIVSATATGTLHGLTATSKRLRPADLAARADGDVEESKNRRVEGGAMLKKYADLSPEQEAIVSEVIGCAIAVHRELGPASKNRFTTQR